MPADVIIGSQWGDEGKGKIVDLFSEKYDVIVRYQGGANAGHTVIIGDKKYVMHLLPSGILHPDKLNIIGNSVVLDLNALVDEINGLKAQGIKITSKNLIISDNAHVVLPYHKAIDKAREGKKTGEKKIGTTGRGIGPAYTDKYTRTGIRVRDLFKAKTLEEKITENLDEKNFLLKEFYGAEPVSKKTVMDELEKLSKIIKPFVGSTSAVINEANKKGKKILFEGAQGALLDIDFGTYPFVTSSNPTIGGVMTGAGVSHKVINKVWGITKAYQTRVGNGPMPTEMDEKTGEATRKEGGEFGATTGRPRRCGWLDLVALKYVCELNGLTDIILTKIDVLSIFDEIKVCTEYMYKSKKTRSFVADGEELYSAKPVYKTLKGWGADLSKIRKYAQMPADVKRYIKFIEDYTGVKVSIVSVGPEREQIIKR
ncbi:MAG TPA: adenylosuccinate synthase [Candidatus Goldiibacteriota bacterium]|nr:adenylosuccinate synthase [Candidatus Goldiibacteriota bacterium]HPN64689.1 adenylosuccinate synthase [Candidatus Goldiibacteriota bacterium]HRQ43598.1 adenylosuccinate synthase [Candidatus Goldiibacteriota bacterium]